MAKAFDYEIEFERFRRRWGRVPSIVEIESRAGIRKFINGFSRAMVRERMSGDWSNPGRKGVGTRTGTLKREFLASVQVKGHSLATLRAIARMGSGLSSKYAEIQETGRTLRPKHGKYLKVPLPLALTGAGNVKKIATSKNLQLLFGRKRGGRQTLGLGYRCVMGDEWLWVLKKEVKIPPRLGFFDRYETYKRNQGPKTIKEIKRKITARFERTR